MILGPAYTFQNSSRPCAHQHFWVWMSGLESTRDVNGIVKTQQSILFRRPCISYLNMSYIV